MENKNTKPEAEDGSKGMSFKDYKEFCWLGIKMIQDIDKVNEERLKNAPTERFEVLD